MRVKSIYTKLKNLGSHTIGSLPGLEADSAADDKEELLRGEQKTAMN